MVFCLILIIYIEYVYFYINLFVLGIVYLFWVCNFYVVFVNEEMFNVIVIYIGVYEFGYRYCCICFFKLYNEIEILLE